METVLIGAIMALILAFHQPLPPPPPIAAAEPEKALPPPVSPAPEPEPQPEPEPAKAEPKRANASPELVVVLPSADGHVGMVVVERDGERVVLNEAYASSRIAGTSGPQLVRLPEPQVRAAFTPALVALPARPMSFQLYFLRGTDELTDESRAELGRMLSELRQRPAPDILVVGHTDSLGQEEKNDALSLQRAQRVKAALVSQGVAAARVRAAGRGEREPLVPTPDGVDEPRNRRVEISVR